jgi:hypothetical protein
MTAKKEALINLRLEFLEISPYGVGADEWEKFDRVTEYLYNHPTVGRFSGLRNALGDLRQGKSTEEKRETVWSLYCVIMLPEYLLQIKELQRESEDATYVYESLLHMARNNPRNSHIRKHAEEWSSTSQFLYEALDSVKDTITAAIECAKWLDGTGKTERAEPSEFYDRPSQDDIGEEVA